MPEVGWLEFSVPFQQIRLYQTRVTCQRSIMGKSYVIHKPEVHNVFHCRQKRTEPRPWTTRTEIWWNLDCGFWDMRADTQTKMQDRQTNIHTDKLIAILRTHTAGAK